LTFLQFNAPITYYAGTGLNLSPATTFNIATTGVTATTYGSASAVPVIAVNAQGQITTATSTNIAIAGSAVTGAISGQAGSVANALTLGTYLTGTSFNGSAAVTATVDATALNTASKVVARDASGNFAAGTITATLTGNATNVSGTVAIANGGSGTTTAQGAMNAFAGAVTSGSYLRGNGSNVVMSTIQVADVPTLNQSTTGNATTATTATNLAGGSAGTVPYQSAAGTTAMLAAGTAGFLLQSNGAAAPSWVTAPVANNGTLTMAVSGTGLSGSASFTANQATGSTFTVTSNATSANTVSAIVARDASGNFSAGTITASLSGNATTATTATNATQLNGTAQTNLLIGKNGTTADINAANDTGSFSARGDASFPASMSFHRTGVFAINMGLSTANNFVIGGWSATSNAFSMSSGGNLTMTGNVTAFSDERVKTNWRGYNTDFVKELAKLKHGTYDRTDQELTQDGVSAQSLQNLLPNSVLTNEEGHLSVAYGNAAMVSAVELAKDNVELRARIAKLEALVAKLIEG
jgi:hypothetical protein